MNGSLFDIYFDDVDITLTESPIVQSDDYYPFGLQFNSYQRVTSKQNDYLYNGKELQDELDLNWLDYGARMYDPAIGRFPVQDRFSEKYYSMNPYQYGANNPVLFIDVNGDSLDIQGQQADVDQYLDYVNQGLEGYYTAVRDSKTGVVTVDKTNKSGSVSSTAQNYYDQFTGVTNTAETTTINLVNKDTNVPLADPGNKTIDMADISAIADDQSTQGLNLGSKIAIHETAEQYLMQNGSSQGDAHSRATSVENAIDPNIQRTKGTDKVRSAGNQIAAQITYMVNGKKQILQVNFTNNNVSKITLIK